MLARMHRIVIVLALATGLAACGSNGPPPSPCTASAVPAALHLTVSGFTKCSCFNGTFTLTDLTTAGDPIVPGVWTSMPIMGCPGQTQPAYLKFSDPSDFGIGITDVGSEPGSGSSDFSPVTSGTCSPFHLTGGASTAGNITEFCPGSNEDLYMSWSITN
jgi:hypothetical protein